MISYLKKEGFKIIGRKDFIYEILQAIYEAKKVSSTLMAKTKTKTKTSYWDWGHFDPGYFTQDKRQSELSVLRTLDYRNFIQVIQDGNYIIYNLHH